MPGYDEESKKVGVCSDKVNLLSQTSSANIHREIQKSADSSDDNVVLVSQTFFSSSAELPRKIQNTLDSELWTLDSELWTLNSGLWTLDSGLWTGSSTSKKNPKQRSICSVVNTKQERTVTTDLKIRLDRASHCS